MTSWTETELQEYTASIGHYTLTVRLSLFGGAVYVVKCVEHVLSKGDMPTVGSAMRRAEEFVSALQGGGYLMYCGYVRVSLSGWVCLALSSWHFTA